MESPSILYPKKIDLTNCDKEPIHILGKTQNHGFLVAFDQKSNQVTYYSKNSLDLFEKNDAQMLSSYLKDLLPEDDVVDDILSSVQEKKTSPIHITIKNRDYIVLSHQNDNSILIEFESVGEELNPIHYQEQLSKAIAEIASAHDELSMCNTTAKLIKEFYDYDRVMVYQFDSDWNGKVVSEACNPELERWLGLHYPASDIPQQARKLFLTQGVRIIADVNSEPELIVTDPSNKIPLDLSNSELRAVSPIHIEYLSNMKVEATLTAAIIYQNQLWGLIACHNYSPKFINYHHRVSCQFITQVFATQLGLRATNSLLQKTNQSNQIRSKLIDKMSQNWDIQSIFSEGKYSILDITEAKGAAISMNKQIKTIGVTPDEDKIKKLIRWLHEKSPMNSFSTNNLSSEYQDGDEIVKVASGLLAVFISKAKEDVILWFKPEVIQTIDWGGNPNKAVVLENKRISPRKSFEKWSQEQAGFSHPWLDYEIAAAKALKEHIAEIIIQKYEQITTLNQKLQNAYRELESFSYSVSHDLRAPLRGIDGFAQVIKEDYFDSLDDYGKQAVSTIILSIDKMNQLIDDILSFSGLGKTSPKREKISIQKIVTEVLEFIQPKIVYENITIQIEELPESYGDKRMVFQLLNNLIGNALKYSSKVAHPKVIIGFKKNAYYIKDNGIGFDIQHSNKIFGVFNRLVNDEYEGSGIGLAIAKRIVEKHNGTIWVNSALHEGATFYFTLNDEQQNSLTEK